MKNLKVCSCALALFCSFGMINFANAASGSSAGALNADALAKLDSKAPTQSETTSTKPIINP